MRFRVFTTIPCCFGNYKTPTETNNRLFYVTSYTLTSMMFLINKIINYKNRPKIWSFYKNPSVKIKFLQLTSWGQFSHFSRNNS